MRVLPIAQLECWSTQLTQIARRPLEYCEPFARIADRFEGWWAGDVPDRPLFIAAANANSPRPITLRLELLKRPEERLTAKQADLEQTHYVGDGVPHIRVDFGPVLLAGFFGGRREYGGNTARTHSFIQDGWSNEPDRTLAESDPWWTLLKRLLRLTAEQAAGRFLVCAPDLGGSADVLLNLRGATRLCMDVVEKPDRVRRAIEAIYPIWHKAFTDTRVLCEAPFGSFRQNAPAPSSRDSAQSFAAVLRPGNSLPLKYAVLIHVHQDAKDFGPGQARRGYARCTDNW